MPTEHSTTTSLLRVPAVRRLLLADAVSGSGDVTYWIALIVFLLDQHSAGALISLAVVARLVPRVAFGAWGGTIADRFDRRRLMMTLDAARAALMFALALVVARNGDPAVVLAIVFLTCSLSTPYRPTVAAGYPHLVAEDRLASANAMSNTVGQVIGLTGPVIGALLLSLGSPALAIAVNGMTYVIAVILLAGVQGLGRAEPSESDDDLRTSRVRRGFRLVRADRSIGALIGVMASVMLLRGFELVLHVRVAVDQLGLGDAGYGWISAALGLGALLAATRVSKIAESRRPGLVLVVSAAIGAFTLAALSIIQVPAVGLALLVVEGGSTVVFEVLALTLVQRICRAELLGTILGVQNSVSGLAKLAGSLLAPLIVIAVGLPMALVIGGILVGTCLALVAPVVVSIGTASVERRLELDPIVDALRGVPALEGMERPAREWLAMIASVETLPNGTDVVTQGDPADDFFVIRSGEFDVTIDGTTVNRLRTGQSFGEIGLLNRAPRAATVTTTTPAEVWRIPGDAFISAATSTTVRPPTSLDSVDAHDAGGSGRGVGSSTRESVR